uniref:Uncharacterized protein n=1 Tax=Anguilla anguilla TaxID=7936 RepID=A0A0E9Q8Y5_ANGAN
MPLYRSFSRFLQKCSPSFIPSKLDTKVEMDMDFPTFCPCRSVFSNIRAQVRVSTALGEERLSGLH